MFNRKTFATLAIAASAAALTLAAPGADTAASDRISPKIGASSFAQSSGSFQDSLPRNLGSGSQMASPVIGARSMPRAAASGHGLFAGTLLETQVAADPDGTVDSPSPRLRDAYDIRN